MATARPSLHGSTSDLELNVRLAAGRMSNRVVATFGLLLTRTGTNRQRVVCQFSWTFCWAWAWAELGWAGEP